MPGTRLKKNREEEKWVQVQIKQCISHEPIATKVIISTFECLKISIKRFLKILPKVMQIKDLETCPSFIKRKKQVTKEFYPPVYKYTHPKVQKGIHHGSNSIPHTQYYPTELPRVNIFYNLPCSKQQSLDTKLAPLTCGNSTHELNT